MSAQYERRAFLKNIGTGALVLAVGQPLAADTQKVKPAHHNTPINGWLSIASDGAVTLYSNTTEIGQGTGTALAQILANELDLDWRLVKLQMAPVSPAFFNPAMEEYATFGSLGVSAQLAPLRLAAAQARVMLLAAAAADWSLDIGQCDTEAGYAINRVDARRSSFAQLAAVASKLTPPAKVPLLPKERWRFLGKDIARLDLPSKVDGSAQFGVDVQLPGLLVATVIQSPRFGGRLLDVDASPALAVKGVRQVVKLHNAVAVVADGYWAARMGLAALVPRWDTSQASQADTAGYAKALLAGAQSGGGVYVRRNATLEDVQQAYAQASSQASKRHQAFYTVPFLSHATMEPMNATAMVGLEGATLWLPTQSQSLAREVVAKALGLDPGNVVINTTLAGGGFGRRIESDFAVQAALIAQQVGKPVKLIWSREEDMRHDYYRPAAAIQLQASLDAQGLPLALRFDVASEAIAAYSREGLDAARALPVNTAAIGPDRHYDVPILHTAKTVDAGVPVGYWRSVRASHNTFALESFLDELAVLAGVDGVEYKRRLLVDGGREQRALDRAVELSAWHTQPAQGRHRGMALIHANGTVVVHVVELSEEAGAVKLHRITTVVDCGFAVNPRNVRAQIEGGIAFGLSAAFYGEITVHNGAVQQSNFHDYPLLTLAQMPTVTVEILDSDAPAGGVGEEAVGPLAPAVANALFAATGKRMRDLPFSKAGLSLT